MIAGKNINLFISHSIGLLNAPLRNEENANIIINTIMERSQFRLMNQFLLQFISVFSYLYAHHHMSIP